MAKPIEFTVPKRDPRQVLRERLENAPVDHAEALLAAYELLGRLHDHGVLEAANGALGASDHILHIAVEAARTPAGIRAFRNAMILGKALGSVDPDLLAPAIANTLAVKSPADPPSLWSLFTRLMSKDVRRALAVSVNALEALGRSLQRQTD